MNLNWEWIVIHCSGTPNGLHYWRDENGEHGCYDIIAIDNWHAKNGWYRAPEIARCNRPHLKAVGYHKVIEISGAVATGRSFFEPGAHAGGSHLKNANHVAVGICMVGTDEFTEAQWWALRREVEMLRSGPGELAFPEDHVIGHRDIKENKECPGFDVQEWFKGGMTILTEHLCRPRN